MTPRFQLLAIALSTSLASASAFAHDPSLHEPARSPAEKAKPTTCVQLEDAQNYSNDLTDPEIKALKERCDLESNDEQR